MDVLLVRHHQPLPDVFWDFIPRPEATWCTGPNGNVFLRCRCGGLLQVTNHTLAADGSVQPSVLHIDCPVGFHEFVRLDDWRDGPIDAGVRKVAVGRWLGD